MGAGRGVRRARHGSRGRARRAGHGAGARAPRGVTDELAERLLEILGSLGLASRDGEQWTGAELAAELGPRKRFVRADSRNALLQAAELTARAAAGPLEAGWSHSDPLVLETQGVMSAAAVDPLVRFAFPSLEGLAERLAGPSGAFLASAPGSPRSGSSCRRFEHLRVVGLEPSAAPRELAAAKIRTAGLADRIEMLDQRVEELLAAAGFSDIAAFPRTPARLTPLVARRP